MSNTAIAVVGMACRFADARNPEELWENVLAQRCGFRRIPQVRLPADYRDDNEPTPDSTYLQRAAVLEGYEFDRLRFRVTRTAFDAADITQWLALNVAADALADAGMADGGVQKASTGVIVGNTLNGEFSRANAMRLRWPFLRRTLREVFADVPEIARREDEMLSRTERLFKASFPTPNEETLPGALPNIIAGRICNYFDFRGGGHVVDAACASSLLAVANACSALAAGDCDVMVAGGVDVSLDPLELIGFARLGALAHDQMRVFDRTPSGFIPGEGCGFVVLMREQDARRSGKSIYGVLRGWGVSSDGSGGITRPELEGQLLAFERAYARAHFGIETVGLFECHGTGTDAGDSVELEALRRAVGQRRNWPAAIGSLKAITGHTKAAAGVGGLIKAICAVRSRILPPAAGCVHPRPGLSGDSSLTVLDTAQRWPARNVARAGVSAMGFGGINVHVVVEEAVRSDRPRPDARAVRIARSAQDAELLVFAADSRTDLAQLIESNVPIAEALSDGQVTDLAIRLWGELRPGHYRAAVVGRSGTEVAHQLRSALRSIAEGPSPRGYVRDYLWGAPVDAPPRVGLLFPGQGSPGHAGGGALRRRFSAARAIYERAGLAPQDEPLATEHLQPALITASLAAMAALKDLRVDARVAVGHSIGELAALCWAKAIETDAALRIAKRRGALFAALARPGGAMATINASPEEVTPLLRGGAAVIACINGPRRTVVSGDEKSVASALEAAQTRGWPAKLLPVSSAFHSPWMAAVTKPFAESLADERFAAVDRKIASTVTGAILPSDADVRDLLARQIESPVLFASAVAAVDAEVDVWIEAGPGSALTTLMHELSSRPVFAMDAGDRSFRGVLGVAAALYTLGAPLRLSPLFDRRFTRPLDTHRPPSFLENPCERRNLHVPDSAVSGAVVPATSPVGALGIVTSLVAQRTELPAGTISSTDRLLSDLHLNSIAVAEIAADAAKQMLRAPLRSPTDLANATIGELAAVLEKQQPASADTEESGIPLGIDSWVRAFVSKSFDAPAVGPSASVPCYAWEVIGAADDERVALLRAALPATGDARAIAVLVRKTPDNAALEELTGALRAATASDVRHFLMVTTDDWGAALARTLKLERPGLDVTVVHVPAHTSAAVQWIIDEISRTTGYSEIRYDAAGRRSTERLAPLGGKQRRNGRFHLSASDVLLATGGARGITAECVLSLARDTGCAVALIGRSPADCEEVRSNLERIRAAGIHAVYFKADITDLGEVASVMTDVQKELGLVTIFLHGAAINQPKLIADLTAGDISRALASKVDGAANILQSLPPRQLRLVVTLGSVIGRAGLRGAAAYALANECLTRLTREYQNRNPSCRCLAVESSVWSGVGMGARSNAAQQLAREGVSPITPEQGTALLRELVVHTPQDPAVVIMSRFPSLPTLAMHGSPLPLQRFLEHVRYYQPGIEIVVDADLDTDSDPYLRDHAVEGSLLLPAAVGLEAMVQAVLTLLSEKQHIVLENVTFARPVVVSEPATRIRIAALARSENSIEVVLRSASTGFTVDHFRAVCRVSQAAVPEQLGRIECDNGALAIDPQTDLYGSLLFHGPHFRRLIRYRSLRSRSCVADVGGARAVSWFGRYLPRELRLGDPGVRDAALHAIQACVPHAIIVPTSVEQLHLAELSPAEEYVIAACERTRNGNTFIYDVDIATQDGRVRERWTGLELRIVAPNRANRAWHPALFTTYLEQRFEELFGHRVMVAVTPAASADRKERTAEVVAKLLGPDIELTYRPDGKPDVKADRWNVSISHVRQLTIGVAAENRVACDIELILPRAPLTWEAMLGFERWQLARSLSEEAALDVDTASTLVWCASECVKKAGVGCDRPLTLGRIIDPNTILLNAGAATIALLHARVKSVDGSVALAFLLEPAAVYA